MNNKDHKRQLVKRYLENQATEDELKAYFALLKSGELDYILKEQMDKEAGLDGQHSSTSRKTTSIPLWIKIAATLSIILVLGYLFRFNLLNIIDPIEMEQQLTERTERKKLELPDGTKVWLSPGSNLSYPEEFRGFQRRVTLSGEAFFDVTENKEQPFIISSGAINTTVLGTEFNVTAYEDEDQVTVTLVDGAVSISDNENTNITVNLIPSQKAIYDKVSKQINKQYAPDAEKYLTQRDGYFLYKGETVETVVKDIERQYGVEIRISKELMAKDYYGSLDATKNIEVFLEKLSLVLHAKWTKTGNNTYQIKER